MLCFWLPHNFLEFLELTLQPCVICSETLEVSFIPKTCSGCSISEWQYSITKVAEGLKEFEEAGYIKKPFLVSLTWFSAFHVNPLDFNL